MSGDYQLEDTVYIPFSTRQFSDGVPTALVSGEVQIYEDASVTQITGAETLSVSLDSIAGFNMVQVDMTAANGFETGKSYTLVLSAGTVGGVSVVGEVVGHFTVEMSAAALDLANGTDGLGALKTLIDAVQTVADKIPVSDGTNSWNATALAAINAEADTALSDYDPPTNTEMLAATAVTDALVALAQLDLDTITGTDGVTLATAQALYAPATAAALATVDTVVDGIQTDLSNGTDGLGALKVLIDTVDTVVDSIKTETALIYADTNELQTDDVPGLIAALDAVVDTVKAETVLILADTNELQSDDYPTSIAALQTDLDTLTAARSEPTQGAPGVSETTQTKVDYLYKAWRNKSTQTATTYSLFADDASTVDQKATVSDDATTATKGEVATGP